MDQSGSTTEVIFVPPELRNGLPPRYTAALTSAVNLVLAVVARGTASAPVLFAVTVCAVYEGPHGHPERILMSFRAVLLQLYAGRHAGENKPSHQCFYVRQREVRSIPRGPQGFALDSVRTLTTPDSQPRAHQVRKHCFVHLRWF